MNNLESCRKKIDAVDRDIVRLLLRRFKLVESISHHKKKNNIKITDKERELQVARNIKSHSGNANKKFIIGIFKSIINYSKKIQLK